MGTTADKLNRLTQTKADLKTVINYTGANIIDTTPFKDYPKLLNKSYVDIINNGTDDLYDSLPKAIGSGTSLSLETEASKLKLNIKASEISQNTAVLPSAYTQVNYIQSSGTQYIDTGISNSNYLTAIIDVQGRSNASANEILIARSQGVGRWFGQSSAGVYTIGTGGVSDVDSSLRKEIEIVFSSSTITYTVDGTTYSRSGSADDTSVTYTLFGARPTTGGNMGYLATAKIYSVIFKNSSNEIVYNFIPCYRNSDNEVGMYDIVNDVFYTNEGTGVFTYGSTVNIPNPDYPQDIHVITGNNNFKIQNKNLFDKNDIENNKYIDTSGTLISSTSYYASDYIQINNYNYVTLSGNSYIQTSHAAKLAFYNENKVFVSYASIMKGDNTFSIPQNAYYLRTSIRKTDLDNIQIEEGSIASNYVAHEEQNYSIDLGTLEYCKIGDYADQFFKNTKDSEFYDNTLVEGDWYLKKNINKTILTSENIDIVGSLGSVSNHPRVLINKANLGYKTDWLTKIFLINKYKEITATSQVISGSFASNFVQNSLTIIDDGFIDIETARNLLLGTIIYNPLETPTYIHITQEDYSTLYSQLENLYNNAKSCDGQTNITQTNDDLPFILDISALAKIE